MNDSLSTLTANDLMSPDVLMAYEGWSIKRLADFFVKHGISGAPVIASNHELVGVVSVSDVMQFNSMPKEEKVKLVTDSIYLEYIGQIIEPDYLQELAQNADKNCTVNRIMTAGVISTDWTTPLPELAKIMHSNKIHRIFVTRNGLICGVITASNILEKLATL